VRRSSGFFISQPPASNTNTRFCPGGAGHKVGRTGRTLWKAPADTRVAEPLSLSEFPSSRESLRMLRQVDCEICRCQFSWSRWCMSLIIDQPSNVCRYTQTSSNSASTTGRSTESLSKSFLLHGPETQTRRERRTANGEATRLAFPIALTIIHLVTAGAWLFVEARGGSFMW